jgi:hypothetical protein
MTGFGGVDKVKKRDKSRFRVTTFDLLTNPLRSDHPFGKISNHFRAHILLHIYLTIIKYYYSLIETWAPKEIALFETCICRFGKQFHLFTPFVLIY